MRANIYFKLYLTGVGDYLRIGITEDSYIKGGEIKSELFNWAIQ